MDVCVADTWDTIALVITGASIIMMFGIGTVVGWAFVQLVKANT